MSSIELLRTKIKFFKGIADFETSFDPERTIIKAENGKGKTTIADSFHWLFGDKDSAGAADFEIHPLDENNKPLKGVETCVEDTLKIDGVIHVFKKECKENIVKGQMKGYVIERFIDEVFYKEKDFIEYMNKIIPADTMKALTNLKYICGNEKQGGIHWTKRREILKNLADKLGTPKGFNELLGLLNGRTIAQYKGVLNDQKAVLEEKQKQTNPRIEENRLAIKDAKETDSGKLESQRTDIQVKIKKVDDLRSDIFSQETERQNKIEALNVLKGKKSDRESELKNDNSGIKNLLDEKTKIETAVSVCRQAVVARRSDVNLKLAQIKGKESELDGLLENRANILAEYEKADAVDPEAGIMSESDVCFNCGQKVPDKMIEANKKKRLKAIEEAKALKQSKLASISARGVEAKNSVEKVKSDIEKLGKELKLLNSAFAAATEQVVNAESDKTKRFAEIDKEIKKNPTLAPEADKTWQGIVAEITKAQDEIGEPANEQLQALDNRRTLLSDELKAVNEALINVDNVKKAKARIVELEAEEKKLAQQIADIEKQLNDIKNYNMESCKLLEKAVNGKFKHVVFKLFEYQLNGEVIECCEVTLNGVPYSDLSYGQKIFVGIDVINVLSAHYGLSVPLFIDNAEGITLPIEFEGQTIELFAQKNITKLTVETQKSNKRKVA